MKRILVLLLSLCMLILISCSQDEEGNLGDALSPLLELETIQEESVPESSQEMQQEPTEDVDSEAPPQDSSQGVEQAEFDPDNVDYSPYSALIKAYNLDYNITSLGADEYEITGMTLTPINPDTPDEGYVDASGFCYANLVDLDKNGVLELVLVAFDSQELGYDENYNYGDKVYVSELEYDRIIKVYTINAQGLSYIGGLQMASVMMPTSYNYSVEYIEAEDATYLMYRRSDDEVYYCGFTDGFFWMNNYPDEGVAGDRVVHPIQFLDDVYLQQLEDINAATFDFLEGYPVEDFDSPSGAYNDGQFYYVEYAMQDFYPPNYAVIEYYRALTMRDYDTLSQLMVDTEAVEDIKMRHSSDTHTYVPGYIISDLMPMGNSSAKKADMQADIDAIVAGLDSENVVELYVTVNEVLDPEVARLGLQVAGGLYDTYFILSTDDPDRLEWKIEGIVEDKFYW